MLYFGVISAHASRGRVIMPLSGRPPFSAADLHNHHGFPGLILSTAHTLSSMRARVLPPLLGSCSVYTYILFPSCQRAAFRWRKITPFRRAAVCSAGSRRRLGLDWISILRVYRMGISLMVCVYGLDYGRVSRDDFFISNILWYSRGFVD